MRQVVLDTETTGFDPKNGDRLIEIGCIELVNRKYTGRTYHQYVNPERDVPQDAIDVHGITNEFLADKPLFKAVAKEFCEFIDGAELVIHNAPFDVGFLEHELGMIGSDFGPLSSRCTIIDSLVLARNKHPGQRNSLDALCKRYGIDNSHRELHGALLDSEILADVYLLMTGGQKGLQLEGDEGGDSESSSETVKPVANGAALKRVLASAEEEAAHAEFMAFMAAKSGGKNVWQA